MEIGGLDSKQVRGKLDAPPPVPPPETERTVDRSSRHARR